MSDEPASTAVLLCLPEAEPVVHAWRAAGDPSAARGVPAHVTLLTPFLPSTEVDDGVLAELGWFFGGVDAFDVRFGSVGCFEDDGVVHLAPDGPALDDLARALSRRWPEAPPYGGRHRSPRAHLTVVRTDDGDLRNQASAGVEQRLPLVARVAHASLWTCDDSGT